MRRLMLGGLVVAAAVTVALVLRSSEPSTYRVAVVFDTAKATVAGQDVKIAGAKVGKVEKVELVPGPKAKMVLEVERRFAPFKSDAHCTILPSGLISENFVECSPGTSRRSLARAGDGMPTIGVRHTTVPVSLQDVLNVFSLPTDQRLSMLLSQLGLATAGRGADINGILRRANPALGQVRRVNAIIDAQRERVGAAVSQTDRVIGQLARDDKGVRAFVGRAADLSETTAQHSGNVGETIRRLPRMLDAVRPGLRSLDRAATNARPLLGYLRESAPGLTSLTRTLPRFTKVGTPAVRTLARAARSGRPAVKAARPIVARTRTVARVLSPLGRQLSTLLTNLRDTGGMEGVLRVTYAFATNTALYDGLSHVLTFHVAANPVCIAGQQAEINVPGCNAKYNAPGSGLIPINSPGCGPKKADWWDQHCAPVPPGPVSLPLGSRAKSRADKAPTARKLEQLGRLADRGWTKKPASRDQITPLLDYLLK